MKNFIKKRLNEALNVPSSRMPKNIPVNDQELTILKTLQWSDIIVNDIGDDGASTLYMSISFKNNGLNHLSEGIVFTIQLLHDTYYQPHMFIAPALQGIGLGPKILKAFIMEFGHIYAGKGRTLNQDANKMLGKLTTDGDLESYSDDLGLLVLKKGITNKETLLRIIN